MDRGFIREGYFADLVLINPSSSTLVSRNSILSLCGWSPFEGSNFSHQISTTFVNGNIVYSKNKPIEGVSGSRLFFNR
jgi:dihydroorotase